MPSPNSIRQDSITEISSLQAVMARNIARRSNGSEDVLTPIKNLTFFRREAPTQPAICLVEPSVLLVVQGVKQMLLGGERYVYDTNRFLITSLDLPASSQVLVASPETPCLGLMLKLDLRLIADLIAQGGLPLPRDLATDKGMGLGTITPPILEPFKRLLDLLDEPDSIRVLVPLIQREIHYRLLKSDQAARLWQIAAVGSQSHRISRAIDWLKANYIQPLRIDELAADVQMSASSFHQHFRQLTAMSPLQYQKWLRLNEAKRLMVNENLDAASAAFHVGYESPSQFSREYKRLFGAPPKRDVEGLHHEVEDRGRQQGEAST